MGRRWGRHQDTLQVSASCLDEPDVFAAASCIPHAPSKTVGRHTGPHQVWYIEKGQRYDVKLSLDDAIPEEDVAISATEYRLQIRAHFLHATKAMSKDAVARDVGRAEGWVTRWLQISPELIPRPRDVPPYVAEYNLKMLKSSLEPFRPAMLFRRYATDTDSLYEECAQQMPWRQAVFRKRNYQTGEVTVTSIASSRQDCSYKGLWTGIPRLDDVLQRICHQFDIRDPYAYLLNNFYPDGNTSIAPHQHDFWSAILSLGASRVFTLDGKPILLGDGDLLVLGTQRHGVPKMPEVKDGRVSVAIFWYPENTGEDMQCCECGCPLNSPDTVAHGQYCDDCFRWYQNPNNEEENEDEDLIAAAIELSLQEY